MEHDCVAGLYQFVGRCVGEQFSTDDVSQLFFKVFHEPSNADEAYAAMMKISDGDSGWTCVGDNVLDVLSEMEQERKQKEKLYWDHQLLNTGSHHNTLYTMETPVMVDSFASHHKVQNRTGLLQSLNMNTKKRLWSVRKAHRQSWARLVVEGLQSLLPSSWPGRSLKVKGEAWGYVTLSDVLLLVEVKYDVVSQLLYTEMLKEHYSPSVWDTLMSWQQREAEEGLGELAEEALESGDMLDLAELPGAFKTYRFQEQCWSAVSFMSDLNLLRQQEKNALEVLSEKLNMESLRLLCLHVRLATLKAQREKQSYGALVAARQSWETWPEVSGPLRAEQAAVLLHSEDNEHKEEFISDLPQQAVLQLLVLTQEQERKQLIKLVQGVSVGDVQGLGGTESLKEEKSENCLRMGCVKRLQQIYSRLQTKTHVEPRLQDCALHLLIRLMKRQEVQTSGLLPQLVDQSAQTLRSLQEEYRAARLAQSLPNLLHLLTLEDPLESSSSFRHNSTFIQNISNENDKSYRNSSPEDQTGNTVTGDSSVGASGVNREQAAAVCTGCGAVMVDLPYLEVLCMSDTTSDAPKERAEGEKTSEDSQRFEKQGSLIALAWSKPHHSDGCEEAVDRGPLQGQLNETNNMEETLCETLGEDPTQPVEQQCSTEQISSHERPIHEDEIEVQTLVVEVTQLTSSTDSSDSEQHNSDPETADEVKDEGCPSAGEVNVKEQEPTESEDLSSDAAEILRESTLTEKACAVEPMSAMERERTMRSLVDMQKKVGERQQRDRERQLLKVQERLSIIQNRKAEEDLLGLKDRLQLLTHDLPQEDITQQKAVVKERLEQLRRERSYILQSKRDKNTAGFKELLGPVVLQNTKIDEDTD